MLQALTQLPPPTEIEKRNPKTISVSGSAVGSIIYTVPVGRVFRGRVGSNTSGIGVVKINNYSNGSFGNGQTSTTPLGANAAQDLMLFSGDTISISTGAVVYVLGVEYDA